MRRTGRLLLILCVGLLVSPLGRAEFLSGSTFQQWGKETVDRIIDDFARTDGLYTHDASATWADYAWGQGVMLHALNAAAAMDSSYVPKARANADRFRARYWCTQNGTSGFNASYGNCGDRYYDDNAWIALALLELYELTGDSKYLTWARETVVFCMSGENGPGDSPDGGIRWHESRTSGASVCATAPTILSNLILYQVTGIASYYTDGLRLYNWLMNSNLRSSNGIFHETNEGPLGYQTAVMTQCAVRLWQITGNASYLAEAQRMAGGMESIFINTASGALKQTGKWGGHDMTNAYVELYQADGNTHWLDVAAEYLEFLYVNCVYVDNGLFPKSWNDTSGFNSDPDYYYELIDNASVARALWKMASTPGGTTRYDYFERTLRGRWTLDETSGTVAADSSGFNQPGTLGGTSFTFNGSAAAGALNGALRFDGTDDYIDLPDGFANFKGGITVSVWAYPTAVKGWARFLDMGNGEYNNNIVFGRQGSTNDLFFEAYDGTSSGGQVRATGAIALNQWQLFTATLDGWGNVKLYKNGVQVATGTTAVPSNIPRVNNYIGRSNWAGDAYYAGRMDDVRIYNYALSPAEVAAMYQAGGQAENPSPADGAVNVTEQVDLAWTASSLAVGHHVYLGTDEAAVAGASTDSPEYVGLYGQTNCPADLSANTTWYWRVDEVTAGGAVVAGRVWRFTTFVEPTQGLWTHMTMDNAFIDGQTAIDSGGSPHLSGTLVGPSTGTAGRVGEALNFDGSNDYVDLPDGFADLGGGLSVSVWAYPTAAGNWARFIDLGNGASSDNIVFAREGTTNTLSFGSYNGSTSGGRITASNAIALNQWQMFTATMDGWGNVKLYKNGVEVARGISAVPRVTTRTNNYIGRSNWSDAYYRGRIDDVAIWGRPLSRDEVAGIYARGLAGLSFAEAPDPEAPVGHWAFNDGGGAMLRDESGFGYDGSLVNMDAASWGSGKQCGGLTLDGIDDAVTVPGHSGIAGSASRTCTAWINVPEGGMGTILSWGKEGYGGKWIFRVEGGGTLGVGVGGGYIRTTVAVADGQWHHVAAVLNDDGSPNVSEIRLFIDGMQQETSAGSVQAIMTGIGWDVLIGALESAGAAAQHLAGAIDEVRIYNRALAGWQILELYQAHALVSDLEGDGDVDLADLAVLAGAWQSPDACEADLTCDCEVGLDDLAVLVDEWLLGL